MSSILLTFSCSFLMSAPTKTNMLQTRNIFIFLLLLNNSVNVQFVSPCPRLFRYEENTLEEGRWYGQIILLFNSDLDGVWVRLRFDRPVIQIGVSKTKKNVL